MAAKVGGYFGKLLAVVFTSVVAPVMVDLAVRDIHGDKDKPVLAAQAVVSKEGARRPSVPSSPPTPSPPTEWQAPQLSPPISTARADEIACVIAQGVGRTPNEAIRDALRAALLRAVAARLDAETWARSGQSLFESLWRDSSGLILGWKELGARTEWRLRGSVHHEEVAVTLNSRVLGDRLRAVQALGWNHYTR